MIDFRVMDVDLRLMMGFRSSRWQDVTSCRPPGLILCAGEFEPTTSKVSLQGQRRQVANCPKNTTIDDATSENYKRSAIATAIANACQAVLIALKAPN